VITPWALQNVVDAMQRHGILWKQMDKDDVTPKKEEQLVVKFLEEWVKVDTPYKQAKKVCIQRVTANGKPKTFEEMYQRIHSTVSSFATTCKEGVNICLYDPLIPEHREALVKMLFPKDPARATATDGRPRPRLTPPASNSAGKVVTVSPATGGCNACGRKHGGECRLLQHPDHNWGAAKVTWDQSRQGKAWAELGFSTLPRDRLLNGKAYIPGRASSNDKKG